MEKQEQKEPSLEEAFQELEAIIEKMQNREVTLEESFSLYEQEDRSGGEADAYVKPRRGIGDF